MALKTLARLAALGLAMALAGVGRVGAQPVDCDANIASRVDGPWAYSRRGDRCEGIFAQPLSGAGLTVVSFTSAFAEFDADKGTSLTVRWPAIGAGTLSIRAKSLQPNVYYRMDSRQPAEAGRYRWPVDVLAGVGIKRRTLGVVGSVRRRVAGTIRQVLVPLRIVQGRRPRPDDSYRLLVRPGVRLREVYLSVARIGADGRATKYLVDEEALGYGFYPAERAILVPLPGIREPGLYRVEIAAELMSGADTTVEAYLLYPDG